MSQGGGGERGTRLGRAPTWFLSVCSPPGPGGPTLHLEAEPKRDPGRTERAPALSMNGPGCEAQCQLGLRDPPCEMGVMMAAASRDNDLPGKGGHPAPPSLAVLLVCSLHTLCKPRLDQLRQEDSLPPETRWEQERLWRTGQGEPHLLGAAEPQGRVD